MFSLLARLREALRGPETLQREIAERRRAESALRESEALYQSLVESLPLNVFQKDLAGRIIFANQRMCETIGRPINDVIGKTDTDLFPPDLSEKYRRDDNRVIVEGVNRVKRHTRLVQQGGRGGTTGGIITQEAPINASNVMLLSELDGKKVPTRVGAKRVEVDKTRPDGTTYKAHRSVRIATKTGEEI